MGKQISMLLLLLTHTRHSAVVTISGYRIGIHTRTINNNKQTVWNNDNDIDNVTNVNNKKYCSTNNINGYNDLLIRTTPETVAKASHDNFKCLNNILAATK